MINVAKSKFYTGSISLTRQHAIASMTDFSHGTPPLKPKALNIRAIMDKVKVKLASWKGSMLTIMGRVHLVNLVISSMFVYSFYVYLWP